MGLWLHELEIYIYTHRSNNRNDHKKACKENRMIKRNSKRESKRCVRTNHFIASHRKYLDVKPGKIKKNYNIKTGFNRKARDEEDVRNVTEGIHGLMPNMWDPDQPV